jgi:hypothetical protein
MKEYPSIPKVLNDFLGRDCIAFRKYDGTNIRVEWARKRGWYKFATRGYLFDKTDKNFGNVVGIFEKSNEALEKAIKDNYPKADSAIVFMEYLGPYSFAGLHDPGILQVENNDPKELVLFDVNIHKRGFVSPLDFVSKFGHIRSAEVVYKGKLTEDFIELVRQKSYAIDEGVVCKGGDGHNRWMCKVKTWEYLKKIQKFFGTSWSKHWE